MRDVRDECSLRGVGRACSSGTSCGHAPRLRERAGLQRVPGVPEDRPDAVSSICLNRHPRHNTQCLRSEGHDDSHMSFIPDREHPIVRWHDRAVRVKNTVGERRKKRKNRDRTRNRRKALGQESARPEHSSDERVRSISHRDDGSPLLPTEGAGPERTSVIGHDPSDFGLGASKLGSDRLPLAG